MVLRTGTSCLQTWFGGMLRALPQVQSWRPMRMTRASLVTCPCMRQTFVALHDSWRIVRVLLHTYFETHVKNAILRTGVDQPTYCAFPPWVSRYWSSSTSPLGTITSR